MSADNWADCPRCKVIRDAAMTERERAVEDAYGMVPVAKFDAMRAELDLARSALIDPTFREDWEIGVFNGEFFVQYKGYCGECNLRFEFKHEAKLDVDGAS